MVCGPSFGASLRLAVYSLNGIVTAAVCAVAVSVLLPDSLLGLGIGLGLTMLVGTYIQGSAPNTQFRLFWSQAACNLFILVWPGQGWWRPLFTLISSFVGVGMCVLALLFPVPLTASDNMEVRAHRVLTHSTRLLYVLSKGFLCAAEDSVDANTRATTDAVAAAVVAGSTGGGSGGARVPASGQPARRVGLGSAGFDVDAVFPSGGLPLGLQSARPRNGKSATGAAAGHSVAPRKKAPAGRSRARSRSRSRSRQPRSRSRSPSLSRNSSQLTPVPAPTVLAIARSGTGNGLGVGTVTGFLTPFANPAQFGLQSVPTGQKPASDLALAIPRPTPLQQQPQHIAAAPTAAPPSGLSLGLQARVASVQSLSGLDSQQSTAPGAAAVPAGLPPASAVPTVTAQSLGQQKSQYMAYGSLPTIPGSLPSVPGSLPSAPGSLPTVAGMLPPVSAAAAATANPRSGPGSGPGSGGVGITGVSSLSAGTAAPLPVGTAPTGGPSGAPAPVWPQFHGSPAFSPLMPHVPLQPGALPQSGLLNPALPVHSASPVQLTLPQTALPLGVLPRGSAMPMPPNALAQQPHLTTGAVLSPPLPLPDAASFGLPLGGVGVLPLAGTVPLTLPAMLTLPPTGTIPPTVTLPQAVVPSPRAGPLSAGAFAAPQSRASPAVAPLSIPASIVPAATTVPAAGVPVPLVSGPGGLGLTPILLPAMPPAQPPAVAIEPLGLQPMALATPPMSGMAHVVLPTPFALTSPVAETRSAPRTAAAPSADLDAERGAAAQLDYSLSGDSDAVFSPIGDGDDDFDSSGFADGDRADPRVRRADSLGAISSSDEGDDFPGVSPPHAVSNTTATRDARSNSGASQKSAKSNNKAPLPPPGELFSPVSPQPLASDRARSESHSQTGSEKPLPGIQLGRSSSGIYIANPANVVAPVSAAALAASDAAEVAAAVLAGARGPPKTVESNFKQRQLASARGSLRGSGRELDKMHEMQGLRGVHYATANTNTVSSPFTYLFIKEARFLIDKIEADVAASMAEVIDLEAESWVYRAVYKTFCCCFRPRHWRMKRNNGFGLRAPDPIYPPFLSERQAFQAPYSPGSARQFLAEAAGMVSNARGMVAALTTITKMDISGAIMHRAFVKELQTDMRHVTRAYKDFAFEIINKSDAARAIDATYVNAFFGIDRAAQQAAAVLGDAAPPHPANLGGAPSVDNNNFTVPESLVKRSRSISRQRPPSQSISSRRTAA